MTSLALPLPRSARGDMLFAMTCKAAYALSRVALPPLVLLHIGLADYGLWATSFVFISYLGMSASGFTLVVIRRAAQSHRSGDVEAIGRLLSTGMLTLGALAAALFALLWAALPQLLEAFHVQADQRALATALWLGACGIFLADMSVGAFANLLQALGRVREEQAVWVGAVVFESALIAALLVAGFGPYGLLIALGARHLLSASANAWLAYRLLPGLRVSWRLFDRTLLKDFAGYATALQVSSLASTLLHSADRLLAGLLIGPQATAVFDLAGKMPGTAASIPTSASVVATASAAQRAGDPGAQRQVHAQALRLTTSILAATMPLLAVFAPLWVAVWLGRAAPDVAPVMTLLTVALHLHLLTGPSTAMFRAHGRIAPEYAFHALRLAGLVLAVGVWFGLAARATATPLALAAAIAAFQAVAALAFLFASHRALGAPLRLCTGVLGPTLAAYAAAAALHAALPDPDLGSRAAALSPLVVTCALWASMVLAAWTLQRRRGRALSLRTTRP